MTEHQEDYSLVVDQGVLERSSGILGRFQRREALAPVGPGTERILIDANGRVLGSRTTAGERYWNGSGRWVTVDTAEHELRFSLAHREADGLAGYDITVTVLTRVIDATEVVQRGTRGVRGHVMAALTARVSEALPPTSYKVISGDSHAAALDARRSQTETAVRAALTPGSAFTVDSWLSIQVVEVRVALDENTARHHTDLIGQRNEKELATAAIEVRKTWARHLGEQLDSPLGRAVEVAAADPTPGNLRDVVSRLD